MRRLVMSLGIFAVAAVLLLSATACEQRTHVLRVANINAGNPILSDVADWWLYNDPTIPDSEEDFELMYTVHDDAAEVEFQYLEVGAGLPTWTPYHVTMDTYTIWYQSIVDTSRHYDSVTAPMTLSVPVDREGKKTVTSDLVLAHDYWKANTFIALIGDEPGDAGFIDAVGAKVRFNGYDSVANRRVSAWGEFLIKFADYYDDPTVVSR
jgi:hypothetical protein